ncbi:MAG: hypothetical protein WC525_09170 [Candidatus Thermoplasmatota archaeon]
MSVRSVKVGTGDLLTGNQWAAWSIPSDSVTALLSFLWLYEPA